MRRNKKECLELHKGAGNSADGWQEGKALSRAMTTDAGDYAIIQAAISTINSDASECEWESGYWAR